MNTREIKDIQVLHNGRYYYGPNQYWHTKSWNALSGCGPTAAAFLTAYIAKNIERCRGLYPYELPLESTSFLKHSDNIRKFVKPNYKGVSNPDFFGRKTVEYALSKGIKLGHKVFDKEKEIGDVYNAVVDLIDENIMPALLVLRNPNKEMNEFIWHWMAITGYIKEKNEIIISTYGKRYELDFSKVWVQEKSYSTDIVYFTT